MIFIAQGIALHQDKNVFLARRDELKLFTLVGRTEQNSSIEENENCSWQKPLTEGKLYLEWGFNFSYLISVFYHLVMGSLKSWPSSS